ncbi:hypothetical protein ACFROC_06535 [Nocardia tengchongensis]|uniref:hypothetical protein n=1 Tax=Nocardia tengchongensis TaxID=2055889 RepID=UPI00368484AB
MEYQGASVPKKVSKLGAAGKPGAGGFLAADPAAEREALTASSHHEERAQLMVLKAKQDNGSRG